MGLITSIKKRYRKFIKKRYDEVYHYSLNLRRSVANQNILKFETTPLISIVTSVSNGDKSSLKTLFNSIKSQYYNKWELCIVDNNSSDPSIIEFLNQLEKHPQVKVKYLTSDRCTASVFNEALKLAGGDYITLLKHRGEITPDALYELTKATNETQAELIYSDEDRCDDNGYFYNPHFKPDFSPDLLLSQNYIGNLVAIKKSILDVVGGFEEGLEGAQEHDLFLKCVEKTDRIYHIPKVLYHERLVDNTSQTGRHTESNTEDAGKKVLKNHLERTGVMGEVIDGVIPGTYRVKRKIIGQPLVSIIIPFKDKPELLEKCIDSILKTSSYTNFEIIGINNNSTLKSIKNLIESYEEKHSNIRFYDFLDHFNYSKINNYAARLAKGKYLLLLNNDIEIISSDWIESLLEFAQRKEIGAVGGKLFYPDGRIQHAGVGMGIGGLADHWHRFRDRTDAGYFGRLVCAQNVLVATGACLMIKTEIFNLVGGFNEELAVEFNDVDLCLRIYEKGFLNIFTPYCQAYHHESVSRGIDDTPERIARSQREANFIRNRHAEILKKGDPYYNPNLSLSNENFEIMDKHLLRKVRKKRKH